MAKSLPDLTDAELRARLRDATGLEREAVRAEIVRRRQKAYATFDAAPNVRGPVQTTRPSPWERETTTRTPPPSMQASPGRTSPPASQSPQTSVSLEKVGAKQERQTTWQRRAKKFAVWLAIIAVGMGWLISELTPKAPRYRPYPYTYYPRY